MLAIFIHLPTFSKRLLISFLFPGIFCPVLQHMQCQTPRARKCNPGDEEIAVPLFYMPVCDTKSVRTMQSYCSYCFVVTSVYNSECDLKLVSLSYPVYQVLSGKRRCENLYLGTPCSILHISLFLCSACSLLNSGTEKGNKKGEKKFEDLCLVSVKVLHILETYHGHVKKDESLEFSSPNYCSPDLLY